MGLSIRALAERLDKSPTFVVLLEKEETPPSSTDETLRSLAKALDVPSDQLYALVRKVPSNLAPKDQTEIALFRSVKKLSALEKRRLLERLRKDERSG